MAISRLSLLMPLLIFLPVLYTSVHAAEAFGILSVEAGVVKLTQGGKERFITPKDGLTPVAEGDELHSGSGARGSVIIEKQNQKITIYPETLFQVQAHTPARSFYYMPFGKTLVKILNALRPGQRFDMQTATATIGVKGTEFVLGSDGFSKTFVLTLEGVVSVINPEFPNMEVAVSKDQATVTERGNPPLPPVFVAPEARDAAVKGDSLKSFEALPVQPQSGGEDANQEDATPQAGDDSSATTLEGSEQTAQLAEAVNAAQVATDVVESAAETVTANCQSSAGCGNLKFSW